MAKPFSSGEEMLLCKIQCHEFIEKIDIKEAKHDMKMRRTESLSLFSVGALLLLLKLTLELQCLAELADNNNKLTTGSSNKQRAMSESEVAAEWATKQEVISSRTPTSVPARQVMSSKQQDSSADQTAKQLLKKKQQLHTRQQLQVNKRIGDCEYEKGTWGECQSNGVQQRTLKLKSNGQQLDRLDGVKCDSIKIIRRECKTGCKYMRGEWSASCTDGMRVRMDTLVSRLGQANRTQDTQHGSFNCQPQRKVTKDCRRACHYIKSAWSVCMNGFKTRNLTLDRTPIGDNYISGQPEQRSKMDDKLALGSHSSGCVMDKIIRRECRARNITLKQAPSTIRENAKLGTKGIAPKLTVAQKRRLKQLQKQQQQTLIQSSTTNGPQLESLRTSGSSSGKGR